MIPKQRWRMQDFALPDKTVKKQLWVIQFHIAGQSMRTHFAEMTNENFIYPVVLGTIFLQCCRQFTYNGIENYFELTI